jgi:hypothetical protein
MQFSTLIVPFLIAVAVATPAPAATSNNLAVINQASETVKAAWEAAGCDYVGK